MPASSPKTFCKGLSNILNTEPASFEDRVLRLIQKWNQTHEIPLEIKARIPSWSLIADICSCSTDVGFLPDFLAKRVDLHPVSWQPTPSRYRLLALYRAKGGLSNSP